MSSGRWCILGTLSIASLLANAATPAVVPFGHRSEAHICSDSIIRVTHRPTATPVNKTSLIAVSEWAPVDFTTVEGEGVVVVTTERLVARLFANDSAVFEDKLTGREILRERGHTFTPTLDAGRSTYQVEQVWAESSPSEGLYGGGGYQNGLLNYKNAPLQMLQFNTEAVVPFFTSTAGYGLLWDNYAWTYLNPPEGEPLVHCPGHCDGLVTFRPSTDGYHFFYMGRPFPKAGERATYGPAGGGLGGMKVRVVLRDSSDDFMAAVVDWERLENLPDSIAGRAWLRAGEKYTVDYEWNLHDVGLYVQGPEYGRTTLRSFLGELVDYYLVYGGTADGNIAGYREITGAAPLYARWVYGFWQCKEHYDTQEHLLEAARGFRNRSIPVDAIVQDWHYWGGQGWGPSWDPAIYPDPQGMVQQLSAMNMHLMVSVWGKFDKSTPFWKEMNSSGFILGDSVYYDAWNPLARELFYNFSKKAHFEIGVDSLWLDATEPEDFAQVGVPTHLGSGDAVMNTYSLLQSQAISEGLRRDYAAAQGARVFSLTRSSFAGQQRTGAALWSGDIRGCWDSLRRQIASSINYQLSGMPYWSEDIGGFFRPADQYESQEYHDMLTRWFQFGVFTPIFRVHGANTKTELWHFGEEVMHNVNTSAINLRYRLLPYVYSGFARVETEGYTMQRGLAMDFPEDPKVRNIADQFMWGDAFLVTPFYTPADPETNATRRYVYFPDLGTDQHWVNFHTGNIKLPGADTVTFKLGEAPVFVRASSIVPLGPLLQHVEERPADPLEIRVYRGRGPAPKFTLFEDDGHSQAYRSGNSSTIAFTWDESKGELVIGARRGGFPGMLEARTFNIVLVRPGHGVGVAPEAAPDAVVRYVGERVAVKVLRASQPAAPSMLERAAQRAAWDGAVLYA